MIAIIDYGAGNLRSIQRALEAHGQETLITDDPAELASADAVVLPGVGNAGHAMDQLESMGFAAAIQEVVAEDKPFLGICVGMQVLFDHQQEGDRPGLGLFPGRVRKIEGAEKLPHIGWNRSVETSDLENVTEAQAPYYYFVHSYIAEPGDPAISAPRLHMVNDLRALLCATMSGEPSFIPKRAALMDSHSLVAG